VLLLKIIKQLLLIGANESCVAIGINNTFRLAAGDCVGIRNESRFTSEKLRYVLLLSIIELLVYYLN
jgi:hypothetical protein